MRNIYILLICLLTLTNCSKSPEITDDMLDSKLFFDQSIYTPERYLVSVSKPNPTTLEAQKPVIIAIHGYSASTFEWDEFRTWAGARTDFSISQVLLGGHGKEYQTFKDSSWKDWRQPIINEFLALERAGYKNISFVGSSTGCTLILQMLASGYFDSHIKPRHVFLIDPIIIPSTKSLTLVSALGPIIGYTTVENTAGEEKYYYHFRPYETLEQLRNVINVVRKDLEKGITLPSSCTLNVYKSEKDGVADPVSAVLIYKGVKTATGAKIDVEMIPSNLHVYTRLSGRLETPTTKDRENQSTTFGKIANILVQ
jgi:carboxylesterase